MNSRIGSTLAISGVLLSLSASTPALAGKPQPVYPYKFTDLGGPVIYSTEERRGIDVNEPDADGVMQIVGWDPSRGSAVWEATTDGVVLSRVDMGTSQLPLAVNDAGWIVVADRDADSLYVDVPGVGHVNLFDRFAYPAAINNSGQVVIRNGLSGIHWTVAPDGTVSDEVDLGDFRPLDVNDWGETVGYIGSAVVALAAVGWFENGEFQFEVLPFPGDHAYATAINNFGEVVGFSYSADIREYIPWLWSPTGGLTVLSGFGVAKDINDRGQIVGYYERKNDGTRACLWENGQLFDLEELSGVGSKNFRLQHAVSINEAGDIVGGTGWRDSWGWAHASFLLTPNP